MTTARDQLVRIVGMGAYGENLVDRLLREHMEEGLAGCAACPCDLMALEHREANPDCINECCP